MQTNANVYKRIQTHTNRYYKCKCKYKLKNRNRNNSERSSYVSNLYKKLSKASLTDEKINSIASTIAPMLNKEQLGKLNKLMETIKK